MSNDDRAHCWGPATYAVSLDGRIPHRMFAEHEFHLAEAECVQAEREGRAKKSWAIYGYRNNRLAGLVCLVSWAE